MYVIAKAAYNSAAYDTRQNAYAQPTYPTQPQYAPYQVSKIQHKLCLSNKLDVLNKLLF